MQALMLAAGMGKRLGKYTENATKCMVPVNGKTLIEYAIESLIEAKIKRLTLVVGYKKEILKDFLKDRYSEIEINYIDNDVYDTTNNIYSLYLAKDVLAQDDTILLESDLIFDKNIIKEIIEDKNPNLAVVSPFETWMDGTCALIDDQNVIKGILGKSEFNWDKTNHYYKTVNIYKFSKEFATTVYMPFLKAYQTAYGKNEYYETVLKVISFLGNSTFKAHSVDGSRWYEIDDPADLAIAETRFSSGKQHLNNMSRSFGGYWRYPSMLDYCYLVNPFFPPKSLVEEMKANFESLLESYPSGDKQQSLLAGKIFGINSDYIAVGNGAAELIAGYSDFIEGKVIVPYPTFNEYPERFGASRTVWLKTDDNFSYTLNDILDCVEKNDAKSVLLINPENPSGHFFTESEMFILLEKLKEKNVNLIFDESFIDFAEKEIRYSLIKDEILEKYPNLIVIKSISKSYGVPGIRLGVLASSNKDFVYKITRRTSIWNINSYGENFLQIFDKYKKFYSVGCDKIADERNRFTNLLKEFPWLEVYPSQANYVLCKIIDKISSEDLAIKLLDEYNIFIKDLSSKKGFENGQYIRLAVRNTEDNDKLITALKEI